MLARPAEAGPLAADDDALKRWLRAQP
jgi:hypothetical protein